MNIKSSRTWILVWKISNSKSIKVEISWWTIRSSITIYALVIIIHLLDVVKIPEGEMREWSKVSRRQVTLVLCYFHLSATLSSNVSMAIGWKMTEVVWVTRWETVADICVHTEPSLICFNTISLLERRVLLFFTLINFYLSFSSILKSPRYHWCNELEWIRKERAVDEEREREKEENGKS